MYAHTYIHTYICACSSADGIFSEGNWSEKGCRKNADLSSSSVSVCECDHLTHFAILLSAAPVKVSKKVKLSLEIIGYVGISVSLLAMLLTIATFIILRYVHSFCSQEAIMS